MSRSCPYFRKQKEFEGDVSGKIEMPTRRPLPYFVQTWRFLLTIEKYNEIENNRKNVTR